MLVMSLTKINYINNLIMRKANRALDILCTGIILFCTKHKRLEDIIVFESHNDFDCNNGAFYEYLLKMKVNEKYKIIWLVKNKVKVSLPANVYAFKQFKFSFKKNYYISRAKFLLSENDMIDKVRNDQISIYSTHCGIVMKNLKGLLNIIPSMDYILSSSDNYNPIMRENFSVSNSSRTLNIGFPANDRLFVDNQEYRKITDCEYKKYFLWMPTFRKGGGYGRNDSKVELPLGIPLINTKEELINLNKKLQDNNSLLTIKFHPKQDPDTITYIKGIKNLTNIKVLDANMMKEYKLDTYRLLESSDALLSDYSSVTYSFLLLNRPLGFVLSDLNDYKLGFCIDNYEDYLPGMKIFNYLDFVKFIDLILEERDDYKDERKKLLDWLYEYKDGNASQRLAEFMKVI